MQAATHQPRTPNQIRGRIPRRRPHGIVPDGAVSEHNEVDTRDRDRLERKVRARLYVRVHAETVRSGDGGV